MHFPPLFPSRRAFATVFGPAALVLAALSGCKPPDAQTHAASAAANNAPAATNTGSKVSPAKPYTGDTILIGEYGSLTGDDATFGISTDNAIKMAIEELNAKGGILGKKITLQPEDDSSQADQVPGLVQKLIEQDNVLAILGEVASTRSLAAAPLCEAAGVPMISPSSTNPKVTLDDNGKPRDWIFRACFIDSFQGQAMVKFARGTLKATTAAVLTNNASDYSKGLSEVFQREWTKSGGKIVLVQSYQKSDTDFHAQLTSIKGKKPDVIYIPDYYSVVGNVAVQARSLGLEQPLLGGDGFDSADLFKIGGASLKTCYFTNHYSQTDKTPHVAAFVTKYTKLYGDKPDALAACGYDATYVLADAIKRAGSLDRAKIRDAIVATKNLQGVTGNITINATHDVTKPLSVIKTEGGKQVFVTRISP